RPQRPGYRAPPPASRFRIPRGDRAAGAPERAVDDRPPWSNAARRGTGRANPGHPRDEWGLGGRRGTGGGGSDARPDRPCEWLARGYRCGRAGPGGGGSDEDGERAEGARGWRRRARFGGSRRRGREGCGARGARVIPVAVEEWS